MQLSKDEKKIVFNILKKHVKNSEVRVFGSRYKGTKNKYSDLDLVIVGKSKLNLSQIDNLKYEFEESDLLFQVDILDWNNLSKEFQDIINNGYEVIYPI